MAPDEMASARRGAEPGDDRADEIRREPGSCDCTSRRWGVGIKRHDGTVALEPDTWEPS
jgi:hypothetical protein